MKLLNIAIDNFGCIGHAVLPLVDQGLVYLIGENHDTESAESNGSGKSTVPKAISWCIYGETIDGDKGDEVIKSGEKKAEVVIEASDGNGNWIITRTRNKGKPGLELKDASGVRVKLGKNEIQQRIIDMIGLDFQAFKNSVLFGQNDVNRFAHPRTKDTDRKNMLHKIMRTGVFAQCHEWAKKHHLKIKRTTERLENEINVLNAKQGEHDLGRLQVDVDDWEQDREERVGKLGNRAQELLEDAKSSKLRSKELPTLEKQLVQLDKSMAEADKARGEMDAIDAKLEVLDVVRLEADEDWRGSIARRDGLERELKRLKGDKCPVCTSPMDKGDAAKHKKHIVAEHQKSKSIAGKLEEKTSVMDHKFQQLRTKRKRLSSQADTHREVSRNKIHLLSKIETIKNLVKNVDYSKKEITRIMVEMKRSTNETNPYNAQLKDAKKKVALYKVELAKLKIASAKEHTELAYAQFWVKGFSNQGVPSFVLDTVMPHLTHRANHYLELLADGDITMMFTTQRELKSQVGRVRDEIDIRWVIEGNQQVTPSGGQLKKMEIATDLALMDLVATREGAHVDLLIMDEVLDGLDREGRGRVLRLLQEIRGRRGTIIVISHESDFAEMFESAVCAVKTGGTTHLEKVA
jgi:DNA repair exonuclease SbcCD ATPase subunit